MKQSNHFLFVVIGIFSVLIIASITMANNTLKADSINHFSPISKNDSLGGLDNRSAKSPYAELPDTLYRMALHGYSKLSTEHKISNPLLTIVDFSRPSSEKRLFIIDMKNQKLVLKSLVAHGRNSGEKMANRFSNVLSSLQSSLGFYITGNTYQGNNGYSMKLIGLEAGFNDKAEQRAIVMHGASYVNENVVKSTGRVGRSWGCPAVPQQDHKKIIDLLKQGSCLFIYAPEQKYLSSSRLLNDLKS